MWDVMKQRPGSDAGQPGLSRAGAVGETVEDGGEGWQRGRQAGRVLLTAESRVLNGDSVIRVIHFIIRVLVLLVLHHVPHADSRGGNTTQATSYTHTHTHDWESECCEMFWGLKVGLEGGGEIFQNVYPLSDIFQSRR